MLASLRYSVLFVILVATASCSGGRGSLPVDDHLGANAANHLSSAGEVDLGQGMEFGTINVDRNAAAPIVSNEYVHFTPVKGKVLRFSANPAAAGDMTDHRQDDVPRGIAV